MKWSYIYFLIIFTVFDEVMFDKKNSDLAARVGVSVADVGGGDEAGRPVGVEVLRTDRRPKGIADRLKGKIKCSEWYIITKHS